MNVHTNTNSSKGLFCYEKCKINWFTAKYLHYNSNDLSIEIHSIRSLSHCEIDKDNIFVIRCTIRLRIDYVRICKNTYIIC